MVLRGRPTPTQFPTNSLYTPMDNTHFHSISSVCHPWNILLLLETNLGGSKSSRPKNFWEGKYSPPLKGLANAHDLINSRKLG